MSAIQYRTVISFCTQIVLLSTCSGALPNRVVFPDDVVKFKCEKVQERTTTTSSCAWSFTDSTNLISYKNATEECAYVSGGNMARRNETVVYEGYVRIPEQAQVILCEGNGVESLSVQRVQEAKPITMLEENDSPTIILQRFSEDYGARFNAHDVTNQNVSIDGQDIDDMKLLCIYSSNVTWSNYSLWRQRIMIHMMNRDDSWLRTKAKNQNALWRKYLNFLWGVEIQDHTLSSEMRVRGKQLHIVPLTIRNVTNETSRRYECQVTNSTKSSYVDINVENPTRIGPDEIILIQQIIEILDNVIQGNAEGKDSWYTLASVMSIILILFLYYCKKKLAQKDPHQTSPSNKPPDEEAEAQESLNGNQQSQQRQSQDTPVPLRTEESKEPPPAVATEQNETKV